MTFSCIEDKYASFASDIKLTYMTGTVVVKVDENIASGLGELYKYTGQ